LLGAGERRVTLVRSPKSGVNFFSLGDFGGQMEAAYLRTKPAMQRVIQREQERKVLDGNFWEER
jgi:hypothetical protein